MNASVIAIMIISFVSLTVLELCPTDRNLLVVKTITTMENANITYIKSAYGDIIFANSIRHSKIGIISCIANGLIQLSSIRHNDIPFSAIKYIVLFHH